MCWISCRDTSEPSVMPSSTSTDCVRIGGMVTGRPASAAMPTVAIAPEISPPGRLSHRNNRPPAAPMTSVSSVPKILARSAIAEDIEVGIRLTPPYGKSARVRQMRHAIAALQRRRRRWPAGVIKNSQGPDTALAQEAGRLLRFFGGGLLALGAEFPAVLALKPLGVGFLRTFERGGGPRFLGLLCRRRRGFGLGRIVLGGGCGLGAGGAREQKGNAGREGW